MTYFPDLAHSTLAAHGEGVRAIGWLSARHEYTRGVSPISFLSALRILRQRRAETFQVLTWWPAFAGPHTCEFCGTHLESGEIAVPSGNVLFVAPTMIVHYVETHEYLPPAAFVQAVISCPEPGTPQYADAVVFAVRPDKDGGLRVSLGGD